LGGRSSHLAEILSGAFHLLGFGHRVAACPRNSGLREQRRDELIRIKRQ
jgi:hypothetical protein